jgi:hypothetical protein
MLSATLLLLLLALLTWRRRALYTLVTTAHIALRFGPDGTPLPMRHGTLSIEALQEEVTLEERVERAAAYVHDALSGRFRGVHWALGNQSRIRAQRLLRGLRTVRVLNIIGAPPSLLPRPRSRIPRSHFPARTSPLPHEARRGDGVSACCGAARAPRRC